MQNLVCANGVANFFGEELNLEVIQAINAEPSITLVQIRCNCEISQNIRSCKFDDHVKKVLFAGLGSFEEFSESGFQTNNVEITFNWFECDSSDPEERKQAIEGNVRAILSLFRMKEQLWTELINEFIERYHLSEVDRLLSIASRHVPDLEHFNTGIVTDAAFLVVIMMAKDIAFS